MATAGNGLAAVLLAPCRVTAQVGDGVEVTIAEETQYPFDESVRFRVSLPRPVGFPFLIRVPAWCPEAELRLNGSETAATAAPGQFAVLDRTWKDGDMIELKLPMPVRLRTWTKNRNTVSVDRGPLTYSVRIAEKYVRHGGTDRWPAYDILPDSPWNYGLVLAGATPADSFRVVRQAWPADDQPFRWDTVPVQLHAQARRIPQWTLDEKGLVQEVQASPVKSEEPLENVVLIPMGAARLRVSAFPVIGSGPDAQEWRPAAKGQVTASHCGAADTVVAISAGEPWRAECNAGREM
jgi:hypothetical protein